MSDARGLEGEHVHEKTPVYTIATCQRLTILVWHDTPTAVGVLRCGTVLKDLARRRRDGVALLVVIPQHNRAPDRAARAAMDELAADPIPGLLGAATIYEGTGFVAALIRSAMVGLEMLRSAKVPFRVFRETPSAARWLAALLGAPKCTPASLTALLRRLRPPGNSVPAPAP